MSFYVRMRNFFLAARKLLRVITFRQSYKVCKFRGKEGKMGEGLNMYVQNKYVKR
jgi:hypothetical protein